MIRTTVEQIADFLADRTLASLLGEVTTPVTGVCPLNEPEPGHLSFAVGDDEAALDLITKSTSSLILMTPAALEHVEDCLASLLAVERPRREFARVLHHFMSMDSTTPSEGISQSAQLGSGTVVGAGAAIGPKVVTGENCVIASGAVVWGRVTMGDRVHIGPGASIGHSGFSYEREADGTPVLIPHLAGVTIGSDVEIGANACIDRGVMRDTVVEDHVKIDNLVQVGHNVHIGRGSYLIANSVICGSAKVGREAWIGPGAVIIEGVRVGDRATVGLNATVVRSVPNGTTVMGGVARVMSAVTHGH